MPSKTPKQARFMAAVAHGWHPSGVKAPPKKVAEEFNQADTGTGIRKGKPSIRIVKKGTHGKGR